MNRYSNESEHQKADNSSEGGKHKRLRIKILTFNNLEVIGTVFMAQEGYKARLSDLINNEVKFLSLTEVEICQENKLTMRTPFLCINKQSIIFVAEDESLQQEDDDVDLAQSL